MNHVCPWWFAYTFDHPLRRLVHRPEKILGGYVHEGSRAIDIGCGMGYFTIAMAQLGARVVAVDLQQKMLDVLAKRATRAGVRDRIELRLADENSLHLDVRADFVLAFWMLHEVPDPQRMLNEVRAVLAPGGTLLVAEPRGHVSGTLFEKETDLAVAAGFTVAGTPRIALSRAVELRRLET
jgi:2-polyprenyl-3-methyl-5-hydroxy-6-metoxy-1,4-benzoquinol methylase